MSQYPEGSHLQFSISELSNTALLGEWGVVVETSMMWTNLDNKTSGSVCLKLQRSSESPESLLKYRCLSSSIRDFGWSSGIYFWQAFLPNFNALQSLVWSTWHIKISRIKNVRLLSCCGHWAAWFKGQTTGLPWWSIGQESILQCVECKFDPWSGD